jgi:predicted Ser/Thr protein kinase
VNLPAEDGKPRTTPYPGPFTAPEPAELTRHFPQLEILELIGQGGMGAVYKARQIKLDRLVALKVLPPEWGKDPAFAERFAREARTLAKLNHPHIVAVHDFGESGGLYYLVMEYVDGLNLRETLQAGQFRPEQALAAVPQICDALQYAHEEGVVHRDIKPENILLDRRGRVKIADFGLAKLLNRPRAEFTLTGSRQVMGTVDYMAPEQRSRPLEIDHRADIYSLGVVFYEMLTGELPLGRFAPPSQKAAVDVRLDEVVLRALETEPGRRYQSVSDVKRDVESVVGGAAPVGAPMVPVAAPRREVADLEIALRQVRGPATGLLIAGLVTPLVWLGAFLIYTFLDPRWLGRPSMLLAETHGELPPLVFLINFFISMAPAGILFFGALKMRRCEAYELAFIASITAMTPFMGLVWLYSLPMGLWSLLVLCKRPVREGFALVLQGWGRGGHLNRSPTVPRDQRRELVRRELTGPAAAMLVAGILQCLCQLLLAVPVFWLVLLEDYWILTGTYGSFDWQVSRLGVNQVLLLSIPGLIVGGAWFLLGLSIGIAMIRSAVQMLWLRSHRLAVKGSILAMIPCTLSSVLTLPVGLWAFIALRDLEVEAAFPSIRGRRQPVPVAPVPQPTGPFRRKARSFVESVLAMFVTRPGKDRSVLDEEREGEQLPERS